MRAINSTCLISQGQNYQIKACQSIPELIIAFIFTLQTCQLPVLTKVLTLRDVSNYKKCTIRSDNITPLRRFSAQVTEWTPNWLEKHSVLTMMNCNLPPPDWPPPLLHVLIYWGLFRLAFFFNFSITIDIQCDISFSCIS